MSTQPLNPRGTPHLSAPGRPRSNSDPVLATANRVTQAAQPVVQAVQGAVPVGDLQGRVQAVQGTVPAAALPAQTAANRVVVRQAAPQTTATAERLPSKVRVATEYHGTSCEVSRNKENQAELDRAGELFHEMREHLLSSGAISPEAAVTLEVKLNQAILRYEEGGVMKVIDLVKTQDANCKRIFEEMRSLFPARRPQFTEKGKGNIAGCMPARRCNAVLQQMPSSMDSKSRKAVEAMIEPSFSPVQKDLAKKRMDALEKYHGAALECLKEQIQQKQQQKSALQPTDVEQNRDLQKQIKELQRMQQELEGLDAFAAMTALSFLPQTIDDRGEISRQAERARSAVEQYYRNEHQERAADIQDPHRHDFFLKRAGYAVVEALSSKSPRPELGAYSEEFAGDVAGFLFASSPEARRDYQTYCMQHDLDMKQESLEDAFVYEMARCVNDPNGFDPKTAFQTWMAGLDDESKRVMGDKLQAAHDAWKATLAVAPPAVQSTTIP